MEQAGIAHDAPLFLCFLPGLFITPHEHLHQPSPRLLYLPRDRRKFIGIKAFFRQPQEQFIFTKSPAPSVKVAHRPAHLRLRSSRERISCR